MRTGFDSVYAASGPRVDVACGYIGGDTPHVWTNDEWARRPERWRLPIYVRDGGGNPSLDASSARGWAQSHGQPANTLIALDFEQRVDAGYLLTFQSVLLPYLTIVYGAGSYMFGNPRPNGGYWVAAWDNWPGLKPGWDGHQYQSTNAYDLSVFADTARLWDTQAQPVPVPAPQSSGLIAVAF